MHFLKKHFGLILLLIGFTALFTQLLSTHMLERKTDGYYSAGFTWADLAIHLDYISGFRERGLVIINDNPIYAGEKMAYPFVPDLVSAVLSFVLPINLSLIIPTLIMGIMSVILMYKFAYQFTQSRLAAWLTPILFYFYGSILGLYYFFQEKVPFDAMPKVYAHLEEYNIRFSNVITDYFLPQRTFVWGLVIGLAAIIFLLKKRYFRYAGMLLCLPLIHTHSFIALAIISIFYFVIHPSKKLFIAGTLAVILSLPQLLIVAKPDHASFFTLKLGWMAASEGIVIFWIKNLGIPLFLSGLSFFWLNRDQKKFVFPFICLFITTNIIQFQPHAYDNMKLMLWSFLLMAVMSASLMVRLPRLTLPLLLSAWIATGLLSVYRETTLSWMMFTNEDIALANYIQKHTATDALFLTSDTHTNPVNCLAGRKVFLGYRGWLWTHGIDFQSRDKEVSEIYQGNTGLIRKNGINYVLVERRKIFELKIDEPVFISNYPLVYESENYALYKTN